MKLPRFTLRDLFWLVLVVGLVGWMGLAWYADHQHWVRKYDQAMEERAAAARTATEMMDAAITLKDALLKERQTRVEHD